MRARARLAVDVKFAPGGGDAVRQATQPGSLTGSRPAGPSSLTLTTSRPGSWRIVTCAPPAIECFATFASASDTTKYTVASMAAGKRCCGTSTMVVGTGERSASASTAPASPAWVRTAGCMPRASSLNSTSASRASLLADSISTRRTGRLGRSIAGHP